jgi:hypothetical protein
MVLKWCRTRGSLGERGTKQVESAAVVAIDSAEFLAHYATSQHLPIGQHPSGLQQQPEGGGGGGLGGSGRRLRR